MHDKIGNRDFPSLM